MTRVCCGQPFPLCALRFSHEALKDLLRLFQGIFLLDDAEVEPWPVLRTPIHWEELKNRFLEIQRELFALLR